MNPTEDTELEQATREMLSFRDQVINLIWQDDRDNLQQLCRNSLLLPIFVEKVIEAIAPGNELNDAMHLIVRRVMDADPFIQHYIEHLEEKAPFVSNPTAGREALAHFFGLETHPDEFNDRVQLIFDSLLNREFWGLAPLVAAHPRNTERYIRLAVHHLGQDLNPQSLGFQLLCEMAVAYRKHHGGSDLLALLEQAGGGLNLLMDQSDIDTYTINDFGQSNSLLPLFSEAIQGRERIADGDLVGASELYERVIPQLEVLLNGKVEQIGEHANALMFSGVLLALNGDCTAAAKRFMMCMQKTLYPPYGYGTLFALDTTRLMEHGATVRSALIRLPRDTFSSKAFDRFLELATSHSYADEINGYQEFMTAAGDRMMDVGLELSDRLLKGFEAKRNPIVPYTLCEQQARVFRACHFACIGDLARAESEFRLGVRNDLSDEDLRHAFSVLAEDPEKMLTRLFGD